MFDRFINYVHDAIALFDIDLNQTETIYAVIAIVSVSLIRIYRKS